MTSRGFRLGGASSTASCAAPHPKMLRTIFESSKNIPSFATRSMERVSLMRKTYKAVALLIYWTVGTKVKPKSGDLTEFQVLILGRLLPVIIAGGPAGLR